MSRFSRVFRTGKTRSVCFLPLAIAYCLWSILPHGLLIRHYHPAAGRGHEHTGLTGHALKLRNQILGLTYGFDAREGSDGHAGMETAGHAAGNGPGTAAGEYAGLSAPGENAEEGAGENADQAEASQAVSAPRSAGAALAACGGSFHEHGLPLALTGEAGLPGFASAAPNPVASDFVSLPREHILPSIPASAWARAPPAPGTDGPKA